MNILLITDLYPLKKDKSIPLAIKHFVLAFKELNYNISVIRPNFILNSLIRKHKIFKEWIYCEDGIKIYNKNFYLPFLNDDISFLEEKFDLIISHMPSGNIYADLINKKLKLKHISILHQSDKTVLNNFKYSFYFKKRLNSALKNSDLIGVRNKFLYSNYDFILPSFVEKSMILNNKEINSNEKLKIITLSKLIKRKNIDLVITALSKANFDFEYSIYGDGKEEKKLKNLIKKYNLENKIKIYPQINHENVYEKLDENDVFILPSINETFGLSYIEAFSRGLITVGIKNTGIDGFIQNKENGFLINPNEDEILKTLEEINNLNKEKIFNKTLENARNFEKEKIMTKYVENIKKILWK